LLKLGDEDFCVGRARFLDAGGAPDLFGSDDRIWLGVAIDGLEPGFEVLAMVDTGATYSALEPEISEALGLFSRDDGEATTYQVRDVRFDGHLFRLDVTIPATEGGEHVCVEGLFFASPHGPPFNVLGYRGFLERLRLGLDPRNNHIYVGPG